MTEITDEIKMDTNPENSTNEDTVPPELNKLQLQQMRDVMKSMFDSKYGEIFRNPVDPERDNLPDYFEIITNPIDLSTILKKLDNSEYLTASKVVDDFYLMINNCLTYNPEGSFAQQVAKELERLFNKRMSRMPPTLTYNLPLKRKNTARRSDDILDLNNKEPRDSKDSKNKSKVKKILSPTGLNISNLQLDSSINDLVLNQSQRDRGCKRAIRDNYDDDKASNSHLSGWQAFCQNIVGELTGKKNHDLAYPFMSPVDVIALKIPEYYDVVKFPMDLGTIRTRLKGTYYTNPKQVIRDVRLVFSNCYRFNSPETDVHKCAVKLQIVFEHLLAAAPTDLFQECLIGPEDNNSDLQSIEAIRSTRRSHINENKQFTDFCHGIDKKLAVIMEDLSKIKNDRSNRNIANQGENGQYILKKTNRANQFNLTPLKTISTPPILPKIEPQKVEDCDPMTYDEKLALSSQIMCMSEQKIKEIVSLINQREPWSRKISQSKAQDTVELDLNILQPATLRAIEKYIATATKKKAEIVIRKKCTAEERMTKEEQLRSKLNIMESQLAGTTPIQIGQRGITKSTEEIDKIPDPTSRLTDSSDSEMSDDEFSRRYSLNKSATNPITSLIKKPAQSKEISNGNTLTSIPRPNSSLTQPSTKLASSVAISKPNTSSIEKAQGSGSFISQLVGTQNSASGIGSKPQTPSKLTPAKINGELKSSPNDVASNIVQKANICETKLSS